jgi:hypothetical protein
MGEIVFVWFRIRLLISVNIRIYQLKKQDVHLGLQPQWTQGENVGCLIDIMLC